LIGRGGTDHLTPARGAPTSAAASPAATSSPT
jgi:hypothetical protein